MTKDLITVIVPVYNAEKYLTRCIKSILLQTYKNIQLILINDGSTDNSLRIIEEYAANDNRIVVIDKENAGVSDSRNRGLDIAEGEYIGFVDADDYIEPNMYELMHYEISSSNASICCCGYRQEYTGYRYDIAINEKIIISGEENVISRYLRQDIRNGIFDGNWNKLFRRDCIGNIRYKNIKHGEDILFQYNTFKKCSEMICLPDLLYHYVNNDNSATNSVFNNNKLSIVDVAWEIKNDAISNYPGLIEQAYAFNLTWNIALLQDYYRNESHLRSCEFTKVIRREFIKNSGLYINNRYSKRLDQYYLRAHIVGLMRLAMLVRLIIREIKPSRDIIYE